MALSRWWRRGHALFRGLKRSQPFKARLKTLAKPTLELLEERLAPTGTPNYWKAPAGSGPGDWGLAANWSLGHVPNSTEDATFDGRSQRSATILSGEQGIAGNVAGIMITGAYKGAINDGLITLTIGADGFALANGTSTWPATGRLREAHLARLTELSPSPPPARKRSIAADRVFTIWRIPAPARFSWSIMP